MSAWPTDDLTSTYLDSGSDDPALARAELYALLQKVKTILAARNDDDGICGLDTAGTVPESNHRIQTIPGLVGNNGSLWAGPSTWSASRPSTGTFLVTHNLNHANYIVVANAKTGQYNVGSDSTNNDGEKFYLTCKDVSTGSSANSDIYFLLVTYDTTSYTWP